MPKFGLLFTRPAVFYLGPGPRGRKHVKRCSPRLCQVLGCILFLHLVIGFYRTRRTSLHVFVSFLY